MNIILQCKFFCVGWLPATHKHLSNFCCPYILVYVVASNTSHLLFSSHLFGMWNHSQLHLRGKMLILFFVVIFLFVCLSVCLFTCFLFVCLHSYGSATGRIWLDNVRCSGSEVTLTSCQRRFFGSHDCSHSEDVAIDCIYTPGNNPTIN